MHQKELRGFVKLKKIQICKKNSKVDLGFFLENLGFLCCYLLLYMFPKKIFKNGYEGGWVGGVWPIRVFLVYLDFFKLGKTPN